MTNFDQYFQTSADIRSIPHHYEQFWKTAIQSLKSVPVNLKVTRKKAMLLNRYNEFELAFDGIGKYNLSGKLFMPLKSNEKPPIIIRFPDYMEEPKFIPELYDSGYAQFILDLRGHKEALAVYKKSEETQTASFGFFGENMLETAEYYMYKLYLDAIRSLEVIRLIKEVDKNKISLWGKGTGAAMAVFLQHNTERISSMILEEPAFMYLELTQNVSKSFYAEEINQYIKKNKNAKKKVKDNLAYFDAIYLADKIKIPVMMLINIEKKDTAPQGGFALFHRIPENKDMVISTKADEPSREDEKKTLSEAVAFFNETLK